MSQRRSWCIGALIVATLTCACSGPRAPGPAVTVAPPGPPVMVFNIVSGPEDPQAITMALQLAGHALDAGRPVVLFFNVRGVQIATRGLSETLAFKDRPIKGLLQQLLARGAEGQVCPSCLKALGIAEGDLIPGVRVTNRDLLFGRVKPPAVVFTY